MIIRLLSSLTLLILLSFLNLRISAAPHNSSNNANDSAVDTIPANQLLYNGRIWRNLYAAIRGDQYLFSGDFLPGQVTMNNKSFINLRLRYDILNDEIMVVTDKGIILQLNKEMIDDFTVTFNSRKYYFLNMKTDSADALSGYVNVVYDGRSSLLTKYLKEISTMGPGKNYEDFIRIDRIYIKKDGIVHQIRNKRDFKKLFSEKWSEIREFTRENRIRVLIKSPDTYVPVLKFIDTLLN